MNSIHGWWTTIRAHGPPSISGGALAGAWPPTALGHESSPVGVKRKRRARGSHRGPHRSLGEGVAAKQ
jgi:hypothetical protein